MRREKGWWCGWRQERSGGDAAPSGIACGRRSWLAEPFLSSSFPFSLSRLDRCWREEGYFVEMVEREFG